MKKEDKRNIVIFIVLIVLIIVLLVYNIGKSIKNNNVNRKVLYINNINYSVVEKEAFDLFYDGIDFLLNKGFIYEKNNKGKDNIYKFNNKDYKKIMNISSIMFKINNIDSFINYKNIIIYDNEYYVINDKINTNYIGSKLKIDSYSNSKVILKSINYYCDNYEYIGNIKDDNIKCNYKKNESNIELIFNNRELIINNIDELIKIIK